MQICVPNCGMDTTGTVNSYSSTLNRTEGSPGTIKTTVVLVTCDVGTPGSTSSVAQTGTPRHECGSTVSAGDDDEQYSTAKSASPSDTMTPVCEYPVTEKDEECQGNVSHSINFEGDAERRSVDDYPVAGVMETDKEGHGNVYHKITSQANADEQCSSNKSPALKDIITPDCDSPDSKYSEPLHEEPLHEDVRNSISSGESDAGQYGAGFSLEQILVWKLLFTYTYKQENDDGLNSTRGEC